MSSDPNDPGDVSDALDSLDPITREAVAWLVRIRSGVPTDQDQLDYEAWCSASPGHRAASERAERLWEMLGPALTRRSGRSPRKLPVVTLAALGIGGTLVAGGAFGPPAAWFADETTGVGERRTVALADGSRVELDTRTSLDVAEGGRRLTLHAGQIFVSVARDPTHPFVVVSGEGTAQAIGTAFDVRRDDGATTVAVTEGTVRVTSPSRNPSPPTVDVTPAQAITYAPGTAASPPRPVDPRVATAWRVGEVRFDGRPLGEVMAELGRYRRGVVVFTDDSLRRLPVTGVLRVDNADGALNAVALLAPVSVLRLPWLTIVRSDPARADRPAR